MADYSPPITENIRSIAIGDAVGGGGLPAQTLVTDKNSKIFQSPQMFDVRMYGAVGNGIADDTAAIQDTLNAAGAVDKGAAVYFPPGTYLVTATLDLPENNVRIIGAGPDFSTRIKMSNAAFAVFTYDHTPPAGNTLQIENITIEGTGIAGQTALDCNDHTNTQFFALFIAMRTLEVEKFIYDRASEEIKIIGCVIGLSNLATAVYYDGPGGNAGKGFLIFDACVCSGSSNARGGFLNYPQIIAGKTIFGMNSPALSVVNNSKFSSCDFTGDPSTPVTLVVNGTLSHFINCRFQDGVKLVIESTKTRVIGCTWTMSSGTIAFCIQLDVGKNNCAIIGCDFSGYSAEAIDTYATGLSVVGCSFSNGGGIHTVKEEAGADKTILTGCLNISAGSGVNLVGAHSLADTTIANIA